MVGQADDLSDLHHPHRRVFHWLPRRFVDDVEDLLERPGDGVALRPAGQIRGGRVQERDAAVGIARDHRVTDTAERDAEPCLLRRERRCGLPLGADVPDNLRGANQLSIGATHRRHAYRDVNRPPVLAQPDGLEMFDALAAADARKNCVLLGLTVFRDQDPHGTAEDLGGGISEHALRCAIPGLDGARQILRHNRVVGRIDDRRKIRLRPFGMLAGVDVLHHAEHAEHAAGRVEHTAAAGLDPPLAGAVNEPVLDLVIGVIRQRAFDCAPRALRVAGMEQRAHRRPGHLWSGLDLKDRRCAIGQRDDIGARVPAPVAKSGGRQCEAQTISVGMRRHQ